MATDAFAQAGHNMATVIRAAAGDEAARNALTKIGVELTGHVQRKLSEPGSGRVYHRGSVEHRASAPGEPPAVDRGLYRSRWAWLVQKIAGVWQVAVGTDDERGPWLEYGTSRMAARPHLRPVVETYRNRIGEVIAGVVTEVQRRVAGGLSA